MTRVWKVAGWNGTSKVFDMTFPLSAFNEKQMEKLLQRFICRHLTYDEIAGETRKRKAREGYLLLEVSRDATKQRLILSAGIKPNFTAICADPNWKPTN